MALDVYKDWLGIPDGPRPPDHYALLRLKQFEDNAEKIRANYKKLNGHVRKYASGQYSVQSQELLNELAKAMLCLTDPERKRELDENMGREFEEEKSLTGHQLLQNWLRERGHITRDQLKAAEEYADSHGLSLRDAVVQMKLTDAETASQALAVELGLSYVDLDEMEPDGSVLDLVPLSVVRRNTVLPLFVDDDYLLVACADEPAVELEDELRLRCGFPMRRVIAPPRAIAKAIAKYYAPGLRDENAAKAVGDSKTAAKSDGSRPKASAARKTAPTSRKVFTQLTEAEQRERKLVGYLIMMWATIGSVALGFLLPTSNIILTYLPVLIIAPAAILWVLKSYWR